MKKSRIVFLVSNVLALMLELFGKGAVCNFATPEKTITETYSYFSLVPYGYANFGPFITAILTCILLISGIVLFTSKASKILPAAKILCIVAVVTSLLPLIMFGINYYNLTSLLISVLMIAQLLAIIFTKAKSEVSADETE